jgi:ABC-type Fe3+/spermidine/putrescine transport system ATPase subunit
MLLDVSHIYKAYPDLPVLYDASLAADAGEIICLLGPSGCGKSTMLRIIAGLEEPDNGAVSFDGRDLAGTPVHVRNFGLMFQDYALFPHLTVAENVAFGLRMRNWGAAETAARAREMLAVVGLSGYEARRVTELSGGEQQRVALARSLAPDPHLLMLDEPLGALDRALREQLMNDLRAILKGVGVTTLYVTHDQEEAFAIADRVLIMQARLERGEGGHVVQDGPPDEVYRHPATAYVARFLGFRNLLEGTVSSVAPGSPPRYVVETAIGQLEVGGAAGEYGVGQQAAVLIRPEAADVMPASAAGTAPNVIPGRLVASSFRGSYYLIQTEHQRGVLLTCEAPVTDSDLPAVGEPLALYLNPGAITLLQP